jgi:PAS domain S-box-containing protein
VAQAEDWAAIGIFLAVAMVANGLAYLARARTAEADQRRREADLAAELARIMLRASNLRGVLNIAAQRLAQVLGLSSAGLVLEAVPAGDDQSAIPLRTGAAVIGTLLVPAGLPKHKIHRLRERVVPSLEALLAAAREREATNNALDSSRRELEQFFDLSSDLTAIGGLDGYLNRVNPAFERTLGYSRDELMARPFLHFVHPDDRHAARDRFVGLSGGRDAAHFEGRCIRRDGSVVWLEWNVVADQGFLYGAARDVTERRRSQDRLRKARRIVEESRDAIRVLAEQQASLRRVATLVARGVDPSQMFAAVARELARCLGAPYQSVLFRYEADGRGVLLAVGHGDTGVKTPAIGERFSLDGESVARKVYDTGSAARMASYDGVPGSIATRFRVLGLRTAVGVPIVVNGELWGAAILGSSRDEALPADTEARMADFTDLVATAIANAETRAQLTASRARIVAAADSARRRFERDLHDGAQQRLVSVGLQLRTAEAAVPSEFPQFKKQLAALVSALAGVSGDLQEISRGIHPAILSRGGLGPALKTLARRSAVPVRLHVSVDRRLPEPVEVAAYYVVAEALTNAAKHAKASEVTVRAEVAGPNLCLSIEDDGIGGADSRKGSGLTGLIDRVEALGGQMLISSYQQGGTALRITIPVELE